MKTLLEGLRSKSDDVDYWTDLYARIENFLNDETPELIRSQLREKYWNELEVVTMLGEKEEKRS